MLGNSVSANLLSILAGSFSAESMRQGMSMFSLQDIGKMVLDPHFTLSTLPQYKDSAAVSFFDGEGAKTLPTVLIEK